MEVVILEQMVPENHLLRKLDRGIDFINKLCAPLYSEILGGRWVPQACAQGRALWEIPFRIPERQKRLSLSTKIRADIHQSFRLPRILEQQQRLQKLSVQRKMPFLQYDKKVGDAPCLAGRNPKSSMACVTRACSDFITCSSSPSLHNFHAQHKTDR